MVKCSMDPESFLHRVTEVNLSAFVYRLFHGDVSSIDGTTVLTELFLNYMYLSFHYCYPKRDSCKI